MEKERHVLVIFPHPDDEAFSVSGTLALHREAGTPVTYLCLTLGEMGRNLGNPPFATRESLPKIRKKELIDAANAIGIQDLRMLGLRDKTIEFEDDEKLTSLFTDAINELNPSLIITFYPGYSVHPDHEATARAVVRAVERMEEKERPKLHCVAFSNNCIDELGQPDIVHDITAVEEKKVATFTAHRSQTEAMVIDWKEKFENQDADFLDWIRKERLWTYKF
ncbi:bacillithiol biosynthesis deacetylase BshB2 [Peribacillus frigoritolerans]|mgnify:FL=1|uniref:Bacillithiol biosynthesis deacetylase BshB2 n=3 Tax=Peribacillus TaxID=2675229 RepID=A0AAJ1VE57_9BACI|nr:MULTISPECIES: bacillithiol biosynthesis deacetylase BshB2 [Bacillaceae]KOR81163.1 deacetylase [Bacillus sp. FJAT-21352]KRF50919.1 bacillithiol biosynthesis deacetylase BshB2 [Bacillus sp. Soil745]MBD8137919.1 bacillithiol biosynthesis deacetylase BshB2 [Bacillus sp. CFBP 13597]MBL3643110.1 bacillithiol biosynthesis deacetylase BshB2 [Bacillus sp. RHFB]MDP9738298.1 bacillithiol biosynthesis deacetylase BshB2 [Bacillus sp. B2I3]MEC0271601.1 bacillithiol biosynthesis deacetylase BshB2 [Periba